MDTGAPLTVLGSTINGNLGHGGSAIIIRGSLWMANTTVSGNRLNGIGGAVSGFTTLTNCTITDNEGVGFISGTHTVRNTIIAGNSDRSGPDVFGVVDSQGHNLVGNPGLVNAFTAAGDRVGTLSAPLDPRLDPLADNGGPTHTHALLAGAPRSTPVTTRWPRTGTTTL